MLKLNVEQLHQQIRQMDEREQLLVQYPDLNGPIEHEPSKVLFEKREFEQGHVHCSLATNNFILDMQNQIRTNEIRIELLRKQNDSLKLSLEKLLFVQQNSSSSTMTEQRYEQMRSQSRQEPTHRRYSHGNENTVSSAFVR
jgi:hypothetical protein